ncbi:MAG: hypothetical protein PVG65_06640 [Candidatus Thorarchaeota archaeon]|jgi:hypothetical protein
MNKNNLKAYVASFQEADGSIRDPSAKATAEFLLVHRLCPHIGVGDVISARSFLQEVLPVFASHEVGKGFASMESIWQISMGIPEHTRHLSHGFMKIACSSVTPSIKSALLLTLFLQKYTHSRMGEVLRDVISYQRGLFTAPSLDSLYETTHNCLTFWAGELDGHESGTILRESTEWLSSTLLSFTFCVDLLAEGLSVMLLTHFDAPFYEKAFSLLHDKQNGDGGFPVFEGGPSAFHSSLVALWAVTAYEQKCKKNRYEISL